MKLNVEMIVSVFLFIFIAINSQVLGDDFSKNWTSKIDFAKVNALRIVKSDNPLPPGYLKMVVKKIYEREELERKKLANSSGSSQKTKLFDDPKFKRFACDYYFTLKNSHHLSRIKKIKICNNLIDRLMKMVSKRLLYHSSGKPSLMMDSSGGNSSIVSTTSAPRPSSTSSIITSTESSATSISKPNEVITSTTLSSENPSQMQMVNNTELVSPSSVKTMMKNDSSTATSPPDMKDFDAEKISNDSNHSIINAMNEVKTSHPGATIKNITDVSTSSSMETSPPIAELTPKPSDHDLNNTDMSNSAIQVPNDTKNITSDTSGTFESSIQTVIRNFFLFTPTLNKINLTDSMSPPKASSINDTMINNPDKVTQPNPVAAIDNTTDVSTSSSMETSPPIAELTPKPTDNDSMTTFMRNPADLVPDDSNNITSYTPITSKSPIDIIKMLNMNNINFTVSMTTASFPINGTMINEPNKIMPLNLTAKMIVNGTNTTSPIILPQFNRRDGFEDTSDIVSSTQFPIDILMMNNSHILTPLDSTKTDPSTVLSTNNQTENTTSVSPPTITNSENSTTSKPLDSLTTDDLMSNKKQNSATSDTIPADSSIETSTMSSSHLAAHDSESQGTEPSNIPITTDSTVSSSDTSAKDPPFATTATDAANETSFDDLTPPPLSTNTSLNSSKYHSPINQTSDLNPMIPDIPSFNHSLEAPLVPGSDTNLMNQTTSSSTSGPPVSDNQIKSTTLPPQPINSTNIFSTTQVPMIPIVMTMVSSMNNHSSIDSSIRNESMSANESSTMNPSDSIPIIQTSDSNKMIPNVPSPHPSSPESDSNEKPTTLPPPPFISVNVTSTTQIPIIPIVMTMSPHPINDSSMENESNVSNLITTTTPSNSISIDDDSSRTTPNEPSKNLPSNPQNTSSTHSDPSQPLAVTPVPHESGATLPSADSFATSS
ncbi:uncharacterized protein LOC141534415 [Cotesia typhae]|uniref:uncharacterized protein LOC141534415 n=1 Tax=Cotesia typhae TaxID=2053667 RepID=UPI003D698E5B